MKPIQTEVFSPHESGLLSQEKEIFDLKQLLEISKGLNSTIDYNQLLDSILFICMGQMKVLNACVFTRRYLSRGEFTLHRNYKGFEIDHSIDYILPENSHLLAHLTTNFRCFSINELIEAGIHSEELRLLYLLNPDLIIPLTSKEMLHGIILLGNRIDTTCFTDKERDYLLHISVFAAIAVHNAFLFEMTTTDMMTKLKTRHFFENSLQNLLANDCDADHPLSLLLFDIDFFKKINDNYGHVYGDMVIKEVTKIIRNNIRQNDIAARYGGEEFAVILPNTGLSTARDIAERIRISIENMTVTYQNTAIQTTISVGVTGCAGYCESHINAFIDKADNALYLSKKTGRNKTSILR